MLIFSDIMYKNKIIRYIGINLVKMYMIFNEKY